MNLNNANLKVVAAASTDDLRLILKSIHVTPTYTEATNGHILARVGLPTQYDEGDIPDKCPTGPAKDLKSFIIPSGAVKGLKTFKNKRLPVLDNTLFVDVVKTNENGSAFFSATDLEQTSSPVIQKIDGQYPETDRVIPQESPSYRVGLNISYLEILLGIAKSTGAETVTVEGFAGTSGTILQLSEALERLMAEDTTDNRLNASEALSKAEKALSNPEANNHKPWMIRTEKDNQTFTGLIMPVRL